MVLFSALYIDNCALDIVLFFAIDIALFSALYSDGCDLDIVLFFFVLDIDECLIGGHNCDPTPGEASCTNTIGSWSCACNAGYTGDGVTCTGT